MRPRHPGLEDGHSVVSVGCFEKWVSSCVGVDLLQWVFASFFVAVTLVAAGASLLCRGGPQYPGACRAPPDT